MKPLVLTLLRGKQLYITELCHMTQKFKVYKTKGSTSENSCVFKSFSFVKSQPGGNAI